MKKLVLALLLGSTFTSFSQNSTFNTYVGMGIYNFGKLEINQTLRDNNIDEVNEYAPEINFGYQYCHQKFGFFAELFLAVNNGDSKLVTEGVRSGFSYKVIAGDHYNLKLAPYYRFMGYGLKVTNKQNLTTNSTDLANADGGSLQFVTNNSALGTAFWFEWNKLTLKIGGELSLSKSAWRLENNAIDGLEKENFTHVYVGLAYNFHRKQ